MKKYNINYITSIFRFTVIVFLLGYVAGDLLAQSDISIGGVQRTIQTKVTELYSLVKYVVRTIAVVVILWAAVKVISILISNNRGEDGEASKPLVKFVIIILGTIVVLTISELVAKYLERGS